MSPQSPDTPTTSGAAIEDKALDKESVIELLGEDEKEQETLELEEPPKKGKEDKEKDDKETGEKEEELTLEDELEDELAEVDEDKLELTEAPSRKEILAAYPDLYKKFPQLEKAVYREKAYSELLPTIQDAKLAVEKASLLDQYDKEIMGGSTESLLSTVKDTDKEAFAKVVDNYLPTLYKVDQQSYYHTIGNVIKHTIISMVRDGKEKADEELSTAAAVLNQYIFGTTKFTHPTNLSQEEVDGESKKKEDQISQREKDLIEKSFNNAREDIGFRVDNILKASVDKAIDPADSMTEYVKRTATREVLEGLEDLIQRDTRFKTIYDKLWERAFENDFDKESMDKIKKAYLSKAQTLLPILIKRARNEALKGLNRKASDDNGKDKRGPLPVGKTRSSATLASGKSSSSNNSKSIPRGMTTLEFLNSDE